MQGVGARTYPAPLVLISHSGNGRVFILFTVVTVHSTSRITIMMNVKVNHHFCFVQMNDFQVTDAAMSCIARLHDQLSVCWLAHTSNTTGAQCTGCKQDWGATNASLARTCSQIASNFFAMKKTGASWLKRRQEFHPLF